MVKVESLKTNQEGIIARNNAKIGGYIQVNLWKSWKRNNTTIWKAIKSTLNSSFILLFL